MNFLKIILAAIIFAGSVYPCVDTEMISFSKTVIINASIEHHNNTEDFCSPFCMCTCCSISYSVENIIPFNSYLVSCEVFINSYSKYSLHNSDPFWQPPKV